MLYIHKRTENVYRVICEAFDVQEQRPSIVYIALESGAIFCRDKEIFENNFAPIGNPQEDIEPTGPKAPLKDQLEMFNV